MFDEPEAITVEHRPHETNLTVEEAREGVEEYNRSIPEEDVKSEGGSTLKKVSRANPVAAIRRIWRSARVVRTRLQLSSWERAIHHSPHLQHAFKNAAGVALLSLPVFLSPRSSGMSIPKFLIHSLIISLGYKWFNAVRGQWMVISYVWVLETNTGATWRTGYLRLAGTIIGSIYAYLCCLIARTNPYGLVALMTAADVPVTWIILTTTVQPLGVVINVTLGPITFAEYLQRDLDVSVLCRFQNSRPKPNNKLVVSGLATLRGLMIIVGIVAAIIVVSNFLTSGICALTSAPEQHILPETLPCRFYFIDGATSPSDPTLGHIFDWHLSNPLSAKPTISHHVQVRNTVSPKQLNKLILHYRDIYQHGTQMSYTPCDKRPVLKLELQCRNSLHQLSLVLGAMNDELSWVPVGVWDRHFPVPKLIRCT